MRPYRYVTVYESASRYYVVGSEASEKKFAVLKIDRTEQRSLTLSDGGHLYSRAELNELLAMLTDAPPVGAAGVQKSTDRKTKASPPGLTERVSKAYGLLGMVRFLEGYYMILVTKATAVAHFGYHKIYKIEDVSMLYLPSGANVSANADEQRYLKIFQSVDLTTNFYFSYSYDLSRTLQENAIGVKLGTPTVPETKFVWNNFLLEPLKEKDVSERWMLRIVHGYVGKEQRLKMDAHTLLFVGQTTIELPAAKLSLTLIARRSSEFAGTRFLKRGANLKGSVANDVETEQIVWEVTSSPNLLVGKFTAFVQRRGSVPLIWSQDPANRPPVVMGKPPPILLDINEPFATTAACHFRDLRNKYGSPLVVINLVKRREKSRHESILHDQLIRAISYLNQFLPPDEAILYLSFDVARCNKLGSVMPKLEEIGYNSIVKQGWFQSFPALYCHTVRPSAILAEYKPKVSTDGRFLLQRGLSRTNCVDCLDRTNVAQFVIGKVALACQLYSMGFIDEPQLPLQSQTSRVFEELFEEHGDTLALQYAGSQLVHSIKTYKKTAAFQERSRDVIQTLSRYYSNTFGDYDKQNAINLFLGVYRPTGRLPPLWELTTDVYLHNAAGKSNADYCAWMESSDSEGEDNRSSRGKDNRATKTPSPTNSSALTAMSDYDTYYRTYELSWFDAMLKEQREQKSISVDSLTHETLSGAPQSFMKLWPNKASGTGPETKKPPPEQYQVDKSKKEAGHWSSSEDEGEDRSDFEVIYSPEFPLRDGSSHAKQACEDMSRCGQGLALGLRPMKQVYGWEPKSPSKSDMAKYAAYARLGGLKLTDQDWEWMRRKRLSDLHVDHVDFEKMKPMSLFTTDSVFGVEPPSVPERSMRMYRDAVTCARKGPKLPIKKDAESYAAYALIH